MTLIKHTEIIKEFFEEFKKISTWDHRLLIDVSYRSDQGAPITAATLNDYMIENGYLSIQDSWIEVSRAGARQLLTRNLQAEQIGWNYDPPFKEAPLELASKFLNLFGETGRFFCHGLNSVLDEYPIIDQTSNQTHVNCPFASNEQLPYGYHTYSQLTADFLNSPDGVVAVDPKCLGYLFFPPESN